MNQTKSFRALAIVFRREEKIVDTFIIDFIVRYHNNFQYPLKRRISRSIGSHAAKISPSNDINDALIANCRGLSRG